MNLRQSILSYDAMLRELTAFDEKQPTVADTAAIKAQYNESHRSDPYSLISDVKQETLALPLSEILANPEINLIKPIKPINKKIDLQEKTESGEGIQPIHTAWLGGNLTDEERWTNLKKLKELNPETEIILWVHQLYEPIDANNPMVQRCQELGVHVIPIEKVFGRHLPNPNQIPDLSQIDTWEMYIEGMFKAMYGWSSDIIRYLYLYMYGGVHCDLDTIPLAPIENMPIPTNNNIYIASSPTGTFNDPLAANKFCDEIANVIKEVYRVAALLYKEVIPFFTKIKIHCLQSTVDYEKYYYNLNFGEYEYKFPTIMDLLRDYTIFTTGAKSLVAQFPNEAVPDEYTFPSGYFNIQCSNSWINAHLLLKHFKGSREEAIKLVITNILNDLRREPRLLDIDRYRDICDHFAIGDIVFECLISEPHRQKLQHVKYANIFNSCVSADTINGLFNRDNFPALCINQTNSTKEDFEYYAKMLEYSSNTELFKYLQKRYHLSDALLNKVFSFTFNNKSFGMKQIMFLDYIKNVLLKGKLEIDSYKITHYIMESGNLVGLKYALQNCLNINVNNQLGDYILAKLMSIHNNSVALTELEKRIIHSIVVELVIENKLYDNSSIIKIASIIGFNDREQFITLAEALSQNISDFNAISELGETVLHQAIQHGDIKIIEYLLQKGASTLIYNTNGENALMQAERMISRCTGEQEKQKYRDIYHLLHQYSVAEEHNPNIALPIPSYCHARNGVLDLANAINEIKLTVLKNITDKLANNIDIKIINEILEKHFTNLEEAFRLIIRQADKRLNISTKDNLESIIAALTETLEIKMYKMIVEINDELTYHFSANEQEIGSENNELIKLITDEIISVTDNKNFLQKSLQLMEQYAAVSVTHMLDLQSYHNYLWAADDNMVNDIKTTLNNAIAGTCFITYNGMVDNEIVNVSIYRKLENGQWHVESIPASTIKTYLENLSNEDGIEPIHIYANAFLAHRHKEHFPLAPPFNPTNQINFGITKLNTGSVSSLAFNLLSSTPTLDHVNNPTNNDNSDYRNNNNNTKQDNTKLRNTKNTF